MLEIPLISALKIYLMLTSHLRVIDPLFGGSFERIFPIVIIVFFVVIVTTKMFSLSRCRNKILCNKKHMSKHNTLSFGAD